MNPIFRAAENKASLDTLYQACIARLEAIYGSPNVACFLHRMEGWTVSLNMRADDLESFLDEGRHRNVYMKVEGALKDERSLSGESRDYMPFEAALRIDQAAWYDRRKAYRSAVEREMDLKYGALCAEGNGLQYYGPLTVFLHRAAVDSYDNVFIVKTDSLCYVNAENVFDVAAFSQDLALRENVLQLALVKHETELLDSCDRAMQKHCYAFSLEDRCYLEVQIYDDIKIEDAREVRWSKTLADEMVDVGRRKLNGMINFKDTKDELLWLKYREHQRIFKKIRKLSKEIIIFDA